MEKTKRTQKQKKTTRTARNLMHAATAGRNEPITEPLADTQREAFCVALLTETSVSKAAIKAGYSPNAAPQQATRMLQYPDVQRRLAGLLSKIADKGIMGKQEALELATRRARTTFADIVDLFGMTKEEANARLLGNPSACAIKEMRFYPDRKGDLRVCDIKLYDPRDAYRDLAEFLGWMAPEKIEHSGQCGIVYLPAPKPAVCMDDGDAMP